MNPIFLGAVAEHLKELGLEAAPLGRPECVLVESRYTGRSWKFSITGTTVHAIEMDHHGLKVGKYEGQVENSTPRAAAFAILRLLARRMLTGEIARSEDFSKKVFNEAVERLSNLKFNDV